MVLLMFTQLNVYMDEIYAVIDVLRIPKSEEITEKQVKFESGMFHSWKVRKFLLKIIKIQ